MGEEKIKHMIPFNIAEYKKRGTAFLSIDEKHCVDTDEVVFFEQAIDADMPCVFCRRGRSWSAHYSNGKNAHPDGGMDLVLLGVSDKYPEYKTDYDGKPVPKFKTDLARIINLHAKENGSDTPDFILARYLNDCLKAFNKAMLLRTKHYDHGH